MRVSELTNLEQLAAVAAPWQRLALACSHPTPYMLPAYMLPWLRRLDSRWTCRFAAVWKDSELVGLAPMMMRNVGGALLRLRMLSSPEISPTPPCEILMHPDFVSDVASSLTSHWTRRHDWDAIELASVPCAAPCLKELVRRFPSGIEAQTTDDLRFLCVMTNETDWNAYHAARSKKHRQNLRRGWRYFERIGPTRIRTYPGDADLAFLRHATKQVIAKSWKDDDQPDGWNRFVEEMLEGFADCGLLHASFLMVADEPVAYLFDVPWKDDVYAVQNGYDLAMQPGNPGQLLLADSIRRAHDTGVRRYVMGNRDYLRQWSNGTLDTMRLRIRRRSLASATKLAVYDFVHRYRRQEALEAADEAKNARKRATRHPSTSSTPER